MRAFMVVTVSGGHSPRNISSDRMAAVDVIFSGGWRASNRALSVLGAECEVAL
jgi:hypothetical protein